jgi:hypothetical protein
MVPNNQRDFGVRGLTERGPVLLAYMPEQGSVYKQTCSGEKLVSILTEYNRLIEQGIGERSTTRLGFQTHYSIPQGQGRNGRRAVIAFRPLAS